MNNYIFIKIFFKNYIIRLIFNFIDLKKFNFLVINNIFKKSNNVY